MLSDYPSRSDMRVEQKRRSRKTWVFFAILLLIAVVLGSTYSYWAPAQESLVRAIKVAAGLKGDLRGELAEFYPGQNPPEEAQVVVDGRPPIRPHQWNRLRACRAHGQHHTRCEQSRGGFMPLARGSDATLDEDEAGKSPWRDLQVSLPGGTSKSLSRRIYRIQERDTERICPENRLVQSDAGKPT